MTPYASRTTLQQWILRDQSDDNDCLQLAEAIEDIVKATRRIAHVVRHGGLGNSQGSAGSNNVQGEVQQKLDILANDIMIESLRWSGHWAGLASEEMEDALVLSECRGQIPYLCVFDPLDGSSNIDVNGGIGTIFSVLSVPDGCSAHDVTVFQQRGQRQRAAGFSLYGPSTTLVITTGHGVGVFTLDTGSGEYLLTQDQIRIPQATCEFSVNIANRRFWTDTVRRYIDECIQGTDGPREVNFSMRYAGSMVADVHRLLIKGGVFLYPWDDRDAQQPGKLRLLYEANPMGFIVEQAGGKCSTGIERILEILPESLHQRTPIVIGSSDEIERIVEYHLEPSQAI